MRKKPFRLTEFSREACDESDLEFSYTENILHFVGSKRMMAKIDRE